MIYVYLLGMLVTFVVAAVVTKDSDLLSDRECTVSLTAVLWPVAWGLGILVLLLLLVMGAVDHVFGYLLRVVDRLTDRLSSTIVERNSP